jgi:hypothetical protein
VMVLFISMNIDDIAVFSVRDGFMNDYRLRSMAEAHRPTYISDHIV